MGYSSLIGDYLSVSVVVLMQQRNWVDLMNMSRKNEKPQKISTPEQKQRFSKEIREVLTAGVVV